MTLDPAKFELIMDGETNILIRRDFSHPPARVWRALTEPALIRQWMSSKDDMTRCEIDPRPGGSFHYEWEEFFFSGPILAVDAPHHMTHVEHFSEDASYHVEIATDLAARGTGTRMTMVMRYPNAEARTNAIKMGFTDSLDEVYARLEALPVAK